MENLLPKGMLGGAQRRTLIAGVGAVALAIILLLVYLNHYRNSVKSANSDVTVLTAKTFIPKGTTALELAQKGLFQLTSIPKGQLREGAVTDAAVLHGEVALGDVYPGQQLTIADFGATATSSGLSGSEDLLGTGSATGTYRAVAVSLDSSHGLSPQTQTGDHVDIYLQTGSRLGLLAPDMLILQAPNQGAEASNAPVSGNYVLRVPGRLVGRMMFASGNGTLWFALRPQKGAKPNGTGFVTSDNLFSH